MLDSEEINKSDQGQFLFRKISLLTQSSNTDNKSLPLLSSYMVLQ